MKTFKYILFGWLSLIIGSAIAQQTPADKQQTAISIVGATAHIGNGTVIENSMLIFEDGKLTVVSDSNSSVQTKGTVISAKGKHAYPGFIATNSSLGLIEINAVRASDDQDEIGDLIPHIKSLIAYNAESKVVESMRPNGILIAQVTPKGGRISGTSSVVQFDAWNWEDASIKTNDGIHLNWPSNFIRGRWWLGEERAYKANSKYEEQVTELNTFITEAKTYLNGNKNKENLPFEATKGLFSGEQKLYVRVNDEKGITDAILFKIKHNIEHLVIVGGYQSYKITELLKLNNVAVLVTHTHSLPNSIDDDIDLPFKLPKLLTDAGILVGIQNGNASNFQTRNLPFYAGQVVGQGLDKEQALQLITSNTASILGIDNQYGTLEVGKSATLFISEGDALDMRTNKLTHAFIDGRMISLETHQTTLWKRYHKKYNE